MGMKTRMTTPMRTRIIDLCLLLYLVWNEEEWIQMQWSLTIVAGSANILAVNLCLMALNIGVAILLLFTAGYYYQREARLIKSTGPSDGCSGSCVLLLLAGKLEVLHKDSLSRETTSLESPTYRIGLRVPIESGVC